MALRRVIGGLLIAVLVLAACSPAFADDGGGALRRGKHLARVSEPALAVRTTRTGHADASSQRRSGAKAWSAGSADGMDAVRPMAARQAVRSVETLPSHWASCHLII